MCLVIKTYILLLQPIPSLHELKKAGVEVTELIGGQSLLDQKWPQVTPTSYSQGGGYVRLSGSTVSSQPNAEFNKRVAFWDKWLK